MKKKTFKDDAGDGLESFDDLELWLWAVETQNWAVLDRLLIRRGDAPMTLEARNRLADLLRVRRGRGRPKSDAEQMWQLNDRMMKKLREAKVPVSKATEAVSIKLAKLGWHKTPKQIADRWRKGKRSAAPKK